MNTQTMNRNLLNMPLGELLEGELPANINDQAKEALLNLKNAIAIPKEDYLPGRYEPQQPQQETPKSGITAWSVIKFVIVAPFKVIGFFGDIVGLNGRYYGVEHNSYSARGAWRDTYVPTPIQAYTYTEADFNDAFLHACRTFYKNHKREGTKEEILARMDKLAQELNGLGDGLRLWLHNRYTKTNTSPKFRNTFGKYGFDIVDQVRADIKANPQWKHSDEFINYSYCWNKGRGLPVEGKLEWAYKPEPRPITAVREEAPKRKSRIITDI